MSRFMIELVVVVIYWTECMPRKFGNEIRLPGTTGIDNLPIPLTMIAIILNINKYYWSQNLKNIISTHWRSGLLLCCFHQLLEHSVKFTPLN